MTIGEYGYKTKPNRPHSPKETGVFDLFFRKQAENRIDFLELIFNTAHPVILKEPFGRTVTASTNLIF
ncbi:MAG: hypothetical protein ACO1OQ_02975 [Rufibacter sp.]